MEAGKRSGWATIYARIKIGFNWFTTSELPGMSLFNPYYIVVQPFYTTSCKGSFLILFNIQPFNNTMKFFNC